MIDISFVNFGHGKTYNVKTVITFDEENRENLTILIKRIDEVRQTGQTSFEMVKTVYDSSFGASTAIIDDKIIKAIAEKIGKKYRTSNVTIRQ